MTEHKEDSVGDVEDLSSSTVKPFQSSVESNNIMSSQSSLSANDTPREHPAKVPERSSVAGMQKNPLAQYSQSQQGLSSTTSSSSTTQPQQSLHSSSFPVNQGQKSSLASRPSFKHCQSRSLDLSQSQQGLPLLASSSAQPQQSLLSSSSAFTKSQPNSLYLSSSSTQRQQSTLGSHSSFKESQSLHASQRQQSLLSLPSSFTQRQQSSLSSHSSFEQLQSQNSSQSFLSTPSIKQPQQSSLTKMASSAGKRHQGKDPKSYKFKDLLTQHSSAKVACPKKVSDEHSMSVSVSHNEPDENKQWEFGAGKHIGYDEDMTNALSNEYDEAENDGSLMSLASDNFPPAGSLPLPSGDFMSDIMNQFADQERYPDPEAGYIDLDLECAAAADLEAEGFLFAPVSSAPSIAVAAPLSDEDYYEQFVFAYAEISRGLDNEVRVEEYDFLLQSNLQSMTSGPPGPTWMVTPGTACPILPDRIRRDPYLGDAEDWVKDALDMYTNPHLEFDEEEEEEEEEDEE